MTVFVNNSPLNSDRALTLYEVLQQQSLHEQKGIAVAVNNAIVPKLQWGSFTLDNEDRITIIKATQGG